MSAAARQVVERHVVAPQALGEDAGSLVEGPGRRRDVADEQSAMG